MVTSQLKPHPEELIEGDLDLGNIVGAYRLEGVVGTGGMGAVYRACHALTSRTVAIKVLHKDQLRQERAVDRMMREASILASVSHPGLPRFYECGLLDDGRPWIAMDLIEGTPLSKRMQRSLMPADEVMEFLGAVADVLGAAHKCGVTHRDLKPDNIFLTPNDGLFPVRVIDWGIAHHLDGARFTNMNEAIGTPTYMAPEQARGGPTDGRCDIYGLGILAYQALTGRPPFIGATSVEILVQHLNRPVPALAPRCPDAPAEFVELVERMLSKNVDVRPCAADVQGVLSSLRAAEEPTYFAFALESHEDEHPTPILERHHQPVTTAMRAPRPRVDKA